MPPSGRYMPSSSERYDIYLRGPVRPPLLFSGAPGQMRWASASGRCRTDSPIAGRVGEKHFVSRIGAIRFGTSRAFPARTRVTFPSPEKSPKGRTREGPFRWGPSLMNPTPATTQRGLAPFGNPRRRSGLSWSAMDTPGGAPNREFYWWRPGTAEPWKAPASPETQAPSPWRTFGFPAPAGGAIAFSVPP